MKLLKLTLCSSLFFTPAFNAIGAMSAPLLLKPADAQKEIPKTQIPFSWQKPADSEPFGYRLLISENSRFYGYDSKNDSCNKSCSVFLESKDSLLKKVDLPLDNKIYYWKVQAFNANTEKSPWSITQTFQTQKTPSLILPTLKNSAATPNAVFLGNTVTFSADLSSALPEKYRVKIDYGSGLIEMAGSGKNYQLTQAPTKTGLQTYKIGIYNQNDALVGSEITGTFEILKQESPIKPPPKTEQTGEKFSYTKISADGEELADSAQNWACVRDNYTGLIWEAKTDDGGLHDKDSKYSWYNPNVEGKGNFRSYEYSKWCKGSNCDTYGFMNAVNDERLCGLKDWRMPEKEELMTIVYCSDGKYDDDDGECSSYQKVQRPTIISKYFPLTREGSYWTATQNIFGGAFYVGFEDGVGYAGSKSGGSHVRLVHDGE